MMDTNIDCGKRCKLILTLLFYTFYIKHLTWATFVAPWIITISFLMTRNLQTCIYTDAHMRSIVINYIGNY